MKIFKEMKDNLESPEAGAPRQCRGPRVAAVVGEKFSIADAGGEAEV